MIPGLCSAFYVSSSQSSGGLTAIAYPTYSGTSGTGSQVSPTYTALASGGTAPYTYLWLAYNGDPTISISDPTSDVVVFNTVVSPDETKATTWYCQITDAASNVAITNNVTAGFTASP